MGYPLAHGVANLTVVRRWSNTLPIPSAVASSTVLLWRISSNYARVMV